MTDIVQEAENFKTQANKLFGENHFAAAIELYSKAIEVLPDHAKSAIYYSNRAACHIKLESYGLAIEDAQRAIESDKKYVKGYYRLGAAYLALAKYKDAKRAFDQVLEIAPKDPDAKSKQQECLKAIRAAAFAQAIENENSKPPSETLKWDNIEVDPKYDGPHLPEEGVTLEFLNDLIEHYKKQKQLHRKYVYRILFDVIKLLQTLPTLVDIPVPKGEKITVCGDVHGQFYDMLNIWKINGLPSPANPYLFNGDFVDRGSFSLEIMVTFFATKLLYPKSFHLLRGNHESRTMNQIYGFKGEVNAKVDGPSFELFQEAFNWLPLAAVIGEKVLVVHGGLFSKDGVKLGDIRKIDRNCQPPESGIMCELLWSDPQPMKGRAPSKRGVGFSFGPDVTHRFLNDNKLDLLIRSHEVKMEGYEVEAEGRLITVFSAPNYCDSMGNKGAFVTLDHTLKPKFTTFTAVPHPPVQPMAYADQMFRS